MPKVSEFFGIAIYIYRDDHGPPHFHVVYGGARASFEMSTLTRDRGRLPRRVESMVREWAALHRDELLENWELAQARRMLKRIDPLD